MLYNKTQWRESLEKNASVYYFYSSDPFLARTAAEKTLAELAAATDGEITVLDGPAPGVEELVMAAGTISFFGTRRIVSLPNLQPSSYGEKDLEEVCDVLASAENATFVMFSVFTEERGQLKIGKQAKKLIETCETLGYAAEVAHPGVQELRRMLRQRAEGMNTAMSESAAGLLLERREPGLLGQRAASLLLAVGVMLALGWLYHIALGGEALLVDIALYVLSMGIAFFLPEILPSTVSPPSAPIESSGLSPRIVPATAASPEHLHPRLRCIRSSTTKYTHTRLVKSFKNSRISSSEAPFCLSFAASSILIL